MDFTSIKKYPSQISTAFKRFPLASAFAIFATIAFIYLFEIDYQPTKHKFAHWLSVFPILASMIALSVSLVQESLKKFSIIPHIVAIAIWSVISIALVLYYPSTHNSIERSYVVETYMFIYTTVFLSLFIAPFFKQKNENGFWVFLKKNIKAAIIAFAISNILIIAVDLLLFGFFSLFDIKASARPYTYSIIISLCTIFPILFFSGIPSIDDCLQETVSLNKFQTSTSRFLFLPIVSLYIILLYAYIAKIIIQWEMPKGMVSFLVSASMLLMLMRVTLMAPERTNPKQSLEKKLLKILPAACIPLAILMSVGILRRISDYGISEDRWFVAAINIFFYIMIAILLIDKIKCKSKYIAIVFCSMFFIVTNGPLSAINVTHRSWINSIKTALAEEGYSKFPLSLEETKNFIDQVKNRESKQTNIIVSRMEILNNKNDKELAQYITTDSSIKFEGNTNNDVKYIIQTHISNNKDLYFDIPQNAAKVSYFYKTFSKNNYTFRNDTLFFQLKPKKLDKTFHFFVTRQELEQKSVRFVDTEGAKIGIENLDLNIKKDNNQGNYFNIRGFLFLE